MKPGFALLVGLMSVASASFAENSVVIESKTVPAGKAGVEVGVFLANDVSLFGFVLPLEFREISTGSWLASKPRLNDNPNGRSYYSPLGPGVSPGWPAGSSSRAYHAAPSSTLTCSGPVSHTYDETSDLFDATPPDGYVYYTVSGGCPDCGLYGMGPGADPPGTQNASLILQFDVTTTPGQFEIDTCCVVPANHLLFLDQNTQLVVPSFTKSLITIIPCICPCAADPVCDGYSDVSDVGTLIEVAFRGAGSITDSACTDSRTDVNADGHTDVIDVVRMIYVAFQGQSPEAYFSNPCP